MAKRKVLRGASSNFPGLAYVQRVGNRWLHAMLDNAKAGEELWEDAKAGDLSMGALGKLFANSVDGYYSVLTDAMRLDGDREGPVWLHVPFSKKKDYDTTFERPIKLQRSQPAETDLRGTPFTNMNGGAPPKNELYDNIELIGSDTLLVKLTTAEVGTVDPGQYMSFVFAEGRGAGIPLATDISQ